MLWIYFVELDYSAGIFIWHDLQEPDHNTICSMIEDMAQMRPTISCI